MRWIVRSERPIALAMARPVPMGDCTGPVRAGCASTDGMHLGLRHWRDAGRTGLVAQQTLNAFLGEALLAKRHTIGRRTPTRLAISSTGRRSALTAG